MTDCNAIKPILSFDGTYRFLSNFWPAPVVFEGHDYATVEHAYQAAKTLDENERVFIRQAPVAGLAKVRGRQVLIRKDWFEVRVHIMRGLLQQKFAIPELRQKLLDTGDAELIEGNHWGDCFWGVCRGTGDNQLGKLLMEIRAEMRNG